LLIIYPLSRKETLKWSVAGSVTSRFCGRGEAGWRKTPCMAASQIFRDLEFKRERGKKNVLRRLEKGTGRGKGIQQR